MSRHAMRLGLCCLIALIALLSTGCAERDRSGEARARAAAIVEGIKTWAADHGDAYPPASVVRQDAATTTNSGYGYEPVIWSMRGEWPLNPFTGEPMRPGTGPGDYQYIELGVLGRSRVHTTPMCYGFRFVVYGEDGDVILVDGAGWDDALRVELQGIDALIKRWTKRHEGAVPDPSIVSESGLGEIYAGDIIDSDWYGTWGRNPFTGGSLESGTDPGDYEYVRLGRSEYRLSGFDEGGTRFEVGE